MYSVEQVYHFLCRSVSGAKAGVTNKVTQTSPVNWPELEARCCTLPHCTALGSGVIYYTALGSGVIHYTALITALHCTDQCTEEPSVLITELTVWKAPAPLPSSVPLGCYQRLYSHYTASTVHSYIHIIPKIGHLGWFTRVDLPSLLDLPGSKRI